MNIDPVQILQVTLYSKVVNELINATTNNHINMIYLLAAFIIYKLTKVPQCKMYFESYYNKWRNPEEESILIIPQHKRIFTTYSGGQSRETVQQLYSDRFRALNYFLSEYLPQDINKMIEISRRETKSIWDTETVDYILLPTQNEKILIDKEKEIYFEISITEENRDTDDKKTKDVSSYKNYTYKLSKRGKNQFAVLNNFLEACVAEYKNKILNKKEQSIFEYIKYTKDEDDRCEMVFRKYPFRSNKYLEKNIFFEGKTDFIDYVDRFVMKSDPLEKNVSEQQYEDAGITFKAGIMMIGPPGCGKSSTIRGILNRTKRHGVLVRWSSLNSCSEFCALLRSTKINGVEYDPSELCFIFEDFDANNDDILKCRSTKKMESIELPTEHYSITSNDCSSESSADDIKQELAKTKKALETMVMIQNQKKDDSLTLECVLNTIDGIMELHNIMLIFTTNHLEKIDPAFTRPGRIDYVLKLDNATVPIIHEMVKYKYRNETIDIKDYDDYFKRMNGGIVSPADIQITCLKYGSGEIEQCLEELVKKTNI
jgi:hypothetical protein